MLTVYHNTRIFSGEAEDRFYGFDLRDAFEAEQPITVKRSQLKPVAKCNCTHLEDAYHWTQHLGDGPWWNGVGVELLAKPEQRSTSIGDVIGRNGEFHMVATLGFYPVTVEEDAEAIQTA